MMCEHLTLSLVIKKTHWKILQHLDCLIFLTQTLFFAQCLVVFCNLHLSSVLQVISKDSPEEERAGEENPAETSVEVQLFDSPPMKITVPGDIPWNDPKFSEVVAQEALDRYKETSV